MAFYKKTIRETDIEGKRVLLRVDYNVPLENGKISDDYRIEQSLPTIQFLLERNCKVIVCSHLGRPESPEDTELSLGPVAKRLSELLGREVQFASDCVGNDVSKRAHELDHGQVLLLENLRFHKEEEKNDDAFGQQLASLGEVFVQDAFGVVHRAHASTDAVTRHVYSVAGLLLEREVDTITRVMEDPDRPLAAIIGGAKISDKIDILNRFIDIADFVAVGGAMANTFLLANGVDVAKSKVDKDDVPLAKEIIRRANERTKNDRFIFYLPQDGVVASKVDKTARTRIVDWDAHVIADIENYPKRVPETASKIADDEMILDIGPFSGAFIAGCLQLANTVVWNGAVGVTETPSLQGPIGPFAHGTDLIVDAMIGGHGHKPFTVVGGGDTVGYIESRNMVSNFNHVSTGGGASLELMSGRQLPGVEALENK